MDTGIEKYIPSFSSSAGDWITFHKKLDRIFARKEANNYWIKAWKNTGGDQNQKANTQELRQYMAKKGVVVEAQGFADRWDDRWENFKRLSRISLIIASSIVLVLLITKIYGNLKNNAQ
jgi:hypothetical protein